MRNTTWANIEPGQIVNFLYKGKDKTKPIKRTVLCINPELKYRKKNGRTVKFFVGVQLDTAMTKPMNSGELNRLIVQLGGLEFEEGVVAAQLPDKLTKQQTSKILKQVRNLSKYFRTYNLRECKRKRVFLENEYPKIPDTTVELFRGSQTYVDKIKSFDED